MATPFLVPSRQIRMDGIYYLIRPSSPDIFNHKDLENSFHFNGIAISPAGRFFTFSNSFNRKEWEFFDYGIKGIFKLVAKQIRETQVDAIYPLQYNISYNAHNLTANYKCSDYEETIVCSLYSSNQLRVETFLNHFNDNYIEDKGDYMYDFIPLEDIQKGIPPSFENSLYPVKKKKRWWEI